jgi:hypothetical protein
LLKAANTHSMAAFISIRYYIADDGIGDNDDEPKLSPYKLTILHSENKFSSTIDKRNLTSASAKLKIYTN